MNYNDEMATADDTFALMKEILSKKGNDYSGDDRLSSFKKVADICKISPEMVALVHIATKVVRLAELFSGKEPSNEPVDDSIIDGANYFVLLRMLRIDNGGQSSETS